MYRRTVLGTLAVGCGTLLAGCSGSRVEGDVLANETPLVISHDYSTQATFAGTRVVVDVTAENGGNEPITPAGAVPRVSCTFLDAAGETLYQSGLEVTSVVDVGETVSLEFTLAVAVEDLSRYTLRSEWVQG
jgi:hypothetical protein